MAEPIAPLFPKVTTTSVNPATGRVVVPSSVATVTLVGKGVTRTAPAVVARDSAQFFKRLDDLRTPRRSLMDDTAQSLAC